MEFLHIPPEFSSRLHTYRSNIGCSSGNGKSAAGKFVLIVKRLRAESSTG